MIPVRFVHPDVSAWGPIADNVKPPLPQNWDFPHKNGTYSWTVQTWTYLKRAGWPVEISPDFARDRINVLHYDHLRAKVIPSRFFVVAVQADRGRPEICDLRVVQNKLCIRDEATDFFIPHWTQPGLKPRSSERPPRIERLGYFGISLYLPEYLQKLSYLNKIKQQGVQFKPITDPLRWHDYSEIDAAFGVRKASDYDMTIKPPTKLLNAWAAGVVPLMGAEPAYRQVGHDGQDYLEINSPEHLLQTLTHLNANPQLFQKLLAEGKQRALQFTPDKILDYWTDLLFDKAQLCYNEKMPGLKNLAKRTLSFPAAVRRHRGERRHFQANI